MWGVGVELKLLLAGEETGAPSSGLSLTQWGLSCVSQSVLGSRTPCWTHFPQREGESLELPLLGLRDHGPQPPQHPREHRTKCPECLCAPCMELNEAGFSSERFFSLVTKQIKSSEGLLSPGCPRRTLQTHFPAPRQPGELPVQPAAEQGSPSPGKDAPRRDM